MSRVSRKRRQEVRIVNRLLTWLRPESGQTLVEYGLIIGGVSLAIIAILIGLAPGAFADLVDAIETAMTPG